MRRYVIISAMIITVISCHIYIGGIPSIEKAEFIDSNTIYIYLLGDTSNMCSNDIDIIVNDVDSSYYIIHMAYNIFNGDLQESLYRYKCKLNKRIFPGDVMRIQGNGFNITGDVSIIYE